MELLKLIGIGFVLGITTVIPGVSTGTMAVVFNIYERLIEIITPNVKKIIASWKFWLPLVIGIGIGVIFFSRMITILFNNYPVPTYWFFIGIIAGSIPQVYQRARRPDSALPSAASAVCCVLALACMAVMAIIKPDTEAAVFTVLTPPLFAMLVAGGALAAAAMIIPGISGSFLLLVIGLYRTVIQAISDFNIPLLVPVMIGIIIGIFIGAAFVRFLLAKAPTVTYGAVLGLVAGSIIVLYPGGLGNGVMIIISLACMLAGCALALFTKAAGDRSR
jgi:putative membrane protein